jgi:hypothetical protein
MMSNNKILTVSYGTFSCTLEGFDDSFGTMKAIAEYFRDLASDDRYFGAEPPQPDAEMLARIAEREISRRVEAREHQGRIVLSAGAADAAPAVTHAEVPVATAPGSEAVEPAQAEVASPIAAAESDASTPDVAKEPSPDIAAVATEEVAAEPEIPAAQHVLEATVDAEVAEVIADAGSDADIQEADSVEQTAEEFFAGSHEHDTFDSYEDEESAEYGSVSTDQTVADDTTSGAPVAPDSIAAKLQRIRAVVSQSHDDDDEEATFEDEQADYFAPAMNAAGTYVDMSEFDVSDIDSADDVADADDEEEVAEVSDEVAAVTDEIAEAIADDDGMPIVSEAETSAEGDNDDDVAELLARFDDAAEEETAEDVPAAIVAEDDDSDDLGLDTLAALMAADQDDVEDETDDVSENLFDADTEVAAVVSQDDIEADVEVETEAEYASVPDEDDEVAPMRARVLKVKRADIDAAIESGHLEEVQDADDEPVGSTLTEEQEAELLADLAEVEAELPEADVAEDVVEEVAEEVSETTEAASQDEQVKDDDVSRLMAEADHQMEEPEGSNRRSAFAHLKAAVMAKKADAGIGKDQQEDEGAFRSDLASVVKPRRPEVRGDRDQRPEGARPAPLKLVAEQRVDIDAVPKGPVRPRRVAAVDDAAQGADASGGFAEYAADMGAHNLPDLLEAAASYLSFVEGRDQFSRPQLMTKVRQVEQGDFSREDGLRSFGQLLRAGKIEKIKAGRFAVTRDIGYKPDHRAAG